MLNYVLDQQKRQDAQFQHWSSYQDSLVQLTSWLDNMEINTKIDQVNWLSMNEVKTKLLKLKTCLQDVTSHKRFIENINEKAAVVINTNPNAPSEEIQEMLELVNERYQTLKDNLTSSVNNMEEAVEVIQQYQELERTHQDWQKQMWDKLSVYTDYSGSKNALEARLEKVNEMSQELKTGEGVLDNIKNHIATVDESKIPSKVKDVMERDISNIKFDFSKFASSLEEVKQGLNERLRQWSEFESQLDKLSSWSSETEKQLKNYDFSKIERLDFRIIT